MTRNFSPSWNRYGRRLALLAFTLACFHRAAVAAPISTVLIGSPGNAPDTTSYGSVGYAYHIGRYEVTNRQYTEFLNAADPSGTNQLLLYDSMMSSGLGGISFDVSASSGAKYAVIAGQGNNPVTYVNWFDALRFANWMNNGQGGGSTESGAYSLLGNSPVPTNAASITRNPNADWFLPNVDEWYKAAFFDPQAGHYWNYATGSDTAPTSTPPPGSSAPIPSNTANFYNSTTGYAVTGSTNVEVNQNYLTDVGAYMGSASPLGTYDQGGNAFEWYEATFPNGFVGLRGGAWNFPVEDLSASSGHTFELPTVFGPDIGFRLAAIASVPEPATNVLAIVGLLALYIRRIRFNTC